MKISSSQAHRQLVAVERRFVQGMTFKAIASITPSVLDPSDTVTAQFARSLVVRGLRLLRYRYRRHPLRNHPAVAAALSRLPTGRAVKLWRPKRKRTKPPPPWSVGDGLFPIIPVERQSDNYFTYDRDKFFKCDEES